MSSDLIAWTGLSGALALGVTWILYPGAVFALSLFRRTRPSVVPPGDRVSVILATRDSERMIRRRVRDLLRTEYPAELLEIVVALDAKSECSAEQLRESYSHPAVRICRGTGGGKADTLNTAAEVAGGSILVFADSRQRFSPTTIPALVSAFADPRVGAASGRLQLRARRAGGSAVDLYWRFERWLRYREGMIHSPVGVTGAVSAMRAGLWKPLPSGLILDDVYTPMRLVLDGHRIAYVWEATAFETRRPSTVHEHRRKTRTLTGVLQLCAWLPGVLSPRKNPIFLQFVLHKLARLLTPYAVLAVLLWALAATAMSLGWLTLPILATAGTVGLLAWLVRPGWMERVLSIAWEIVLTQVAVVRATVNGLRGRWEIWD